MKNRQEYFTKIPNQYIQCDIRKKFGINRKFYVTYILLDKYRSYEGYSWITIDKVFEFYGYKKLIKKPKAFKEVLDILEYLTHQRMIEIKQNLSSVSCDTGIEIKIIPENFCSTDNFTKISNTQFNAIMMADLALNKKNILMVFLYINSYIGNNTKITDNRSFSQIKKYPEAFWGSIENMAKDLSISRPTINKCIQYLTNPQNGLPALLIKGDTKDLRASEKTLPKLLPNIYVLNKDGYENEIALAKEKIIEQYQK